MKYALSFIIAAAVVSGCASSSKDTAPPKEDKAAAKVRNQAAFDLECGAEELHVSKVSDDHSFMGVKNATYGVRGCGRQATYKTSCGLGNCSILKDGAVASAS
jgi:hypothetical protein